MRHVTAQPPSLAQPIRRTALRDQRLAAWLDTELEDAISARFQSDLWLQEDLRAYEAQPKVPVRNNPIEGMPAIEVPLIATMTDDLYARVLDLIFSANPTLTWRAVHTDNEDQVEDARVAQKFTEWGIDNEWRLQHAAEHVFLDCVKLGWGVFLPLWRSSVTKTSLRRVTDVGATVSPLPPENFFTKGGLAHDIQLTEWAAHRTWLTLGEMKEYAHEKQPEAQRWNIDGTMQTGPIDWIRTRRETLAGTYTNSALNTLFEIFTFYAHFDYDEDGEDENLIIIFDRTAKHICWLGYNEQETRPYEPCTFQLRAHTLGGIGVARMLAPLQMELTENHYDAMVNSKLANIRMWAGPPGMVEEGKNMRVWSGKFVPTTDKEFPRELKLSDRYPSSERNDATLTAMATARVGSDLGAPSATRVLQSRTPATTALAAFEGSNRRFFPAFSSMRNAHAASAWQCILRYRERLLAGDALAEANILRALGDTDGRRLADLLRSDHFEDRVTVETTAASASMNKETERQDALQILNIMAQYHVRAFELMQAVAAPDTPPEIKGAAIKIATAATELVRRTLLTFDQVRDPSRFLINIEEDIDQAAGTTPAENAQLLAFLQAAGGAPALNGTAEEIPEPVPLGLPNPEPIVVQAG